MYIGPWQEFKLAKILQLKDKLDKEEQEDNQLPAFQQLPPKAYSVGKGTTHSQQKADSRINGVKQQVAVENKFRYKMDPAFAPPSKKVPLLKSTYSEPINRRGASPPQSMYSGVSSSNQQHSTQYTTGGLIAKAKPSAAASSSKGGGTTYQSSTQSASQKASLGEYRAYLRNKQLQQQQLPIDIHYDQWNRFENFLKFASKKEIKDRLKEFEAPPVSNFIDPDVVDRIKAASKPPPAVQRKSIVTGKEGNQLSAKEENRMRIEKMRQLYGLYKQFQEQEEQEQLLSKPYQDNETSTSQLQQEKVVSQQSSRVRGQSSGGLSLPDVKLSPAQMKQSMEIKQHKANNNQIQQQQQQPQPPIQKPVKLPEIQKEAQPSVAAAAKGPSLYNFYQNIIDRSNGIEPQQKPAHSKYNSNATQNMVPPPQVDIVIIEEEEKVHPSVRQSGVSGKGGGDTLEESEDVDGLIKWAKNLPDDIPNSSGASFFIQKANT